MQIDTNTIVSATEANHNFSRVTRIADKHGKAVVFKNNRPQYMVIDLDNSPLLEVNVIYLDCTNDEVEKVGLATAAGEMDYDTLLDWVRSHRVS